jgi:hypothetical protein
MALLAMAIPIAPGKTEQWKKFVAELNGPRRAEFVASRKRLGVHERTFLQHTPHGDLVVVTIEGDNPGKAFLDFGKSTDPFSSWFFQQVQELHGMDIRTPPGPFPEMVVDTGA